MEKSTHSLKLTQEKSVPGQVVMSDSHTSHLKMHPPTPESGSDTSVETQCNAGCDPCHLHPGNGRACTRFCDPTTSGGPTDSEIPHFTRDTRELLSHLSRERLNPEQPYFKNNAVSRNPLAL